jgi:hypothetical protein
VSVDYRLNSEAAFPAQIYDVKAAVRFVRAHADEYGLIEKLLQEETASRACYSMAGCFYMPAWEGRFTLCIT